jgi:FMN phosphatase YigB (HAD superfamily)
VRLMRCDAKGGGMQPLPRPRAVLCDLDDTLTLRRASLRRFAMRFAQDYAACLQPLGLDELVGAMESVDANGYRPRSEFSALLRRVLLWVQPPDDCVLLAYWPSTFPLCSVARAGAQQVLAWLRARSIALGLVTNGDETVQQAKVDALGIRSYQNSRLRAPAFRHGGASRVARQGHRCPDCCRFLAYQAE